MNKRPSLPLSNSPTWGAIQIATAYLLVGGLWILFSDQVAARIALNQQMLALISLYKGWAYVLVTALLLYWLIRRHTAALRASEEQLRRVIDAMPIFISYVDAERRYQFTNRTYKEKFGDQAEGKYIEEVIGKAAYRTVSTYIDKVLSGETTSYETEVPFEDEELFVTATYTPDKTADGRVRGFFVMAQDRTAQRQAEAEHRLWADAFEGCAHGIAIGDPNTNRILVCNPAFARLHKSRVEDVVGSAILSLYAASDHERVRRNIEKADQIGHASYEALMVRRDGSTFPVQMDIVSVLGEDGELLHRVVTAQDISERKQAEEDLRKNEERYRDLFENNPHPMWTYDRKTLAFLDVNEATVQKYGYSRAEFLGMTIADIRPAEDVERLRKHLAQARPALQQSGSWRHRLKDGTMIDVEITSHIIEIAADEAALVVAQDVTERKRAEEKLRESEAKYRTLVEHLPAITYISEPDEYIGVSYISPQIDSYGFDLKTWLADPELWFRHIHPDDQARVTSALQQFQAGAESFRAEYRLMLPNGETRWFHDESIRVKDQHGKTLLKQGFMLDITESKQAQEKILMQASWLDQVNDAVITSDTNFMITGWNPAAERVYGWKAEEVIGKRGEEVFRSEFFSKTRPEVIQELRESSEFSAEITQLRKDGTRIHIETRTVALRNENDQIIGYVSVNRDITERKQAEEKIHSLARFPDENPNPVLRISYEGRIIYANDASETVLREWQSKVGGNLPADWQKLVNGLISTGTRKTLDFQCGELIYSMMIVPVPETNYVNVYGRDVTEHRLAEANVRRSEAQLSGIFNSAMDAIISTDADQRILIFNPAAEAMFQRTQSEAIGQPLDRFLPERFREIHRRHVDSFGQTGITKRAMKGSAVVYGRRNNGEEFPCEASISQIDVSRQKIYTVILRDITQRIQSEEGLRQSEERFASVFRSSPTPIALTRLADGKITDVNEAFCQLFGYSHEEIAGRTSLEIGIADPESRQKAVEQLKEKGAIRNLEQKARDRAGRQLDILNSVENISINGEPYALTTLIDITERKQAEENLRRFELLSQHSRDIILFMSRENGRILEANSAAVQAYGYSHEELLSFTIRDLRASNTFNLTAEQMAQADAGGILFETVHRRKDGSTFPVEVSSQGATIGSVRTLISIIRDTTERKQIEQALQTAHDELELKVQERTTALSEANALLKALMDNMPDHIYFKDLQSRFIRTSKSQAKLLGHSDPAEVIGKTDFDFFPHAARAFAEEQQVMSSGKPLIDLEEWVVWPDGRESWVLTTKMPLRNSEGETIGIFGISHDITERKRSEQEIKQLNADLEKQAEQLRSANKELEAFSYSVSHDLRAPLRAIDGYTRILVEDYEAILDAEGKRVCGIISREARRMGQLIDDLLAFSRLGRKELYTSRIDMRGMAVSVLNELLKEEERQRLDLHIGKLPAVRGDSSLMRQVWFNLLANAIKFTARKEHALIEVGSKAGKDELIYYVRDTGAGFEMEYANKLFGVFQRLHSESEFDGTGVGLAIVQRIIHRHEGRVWAEGEAGKGATFYFALPRKEDHE